MTSIGDRSGTGAGGRGGYRGPIGVEQQRIFRMINSALSTFCF